MAISFFFCFILFFVLNLLAILLSLLFHAHVYASLFSKYGIVWKVDKREGRKIESKTD